MVVVVGLVECGCSRSRRAGTSAANQLVALLVVVVVGFVGCPRPAVVVMVLVVGFAEGPRPAVVVVVLVVGFAECPRSRRVGCLAFHSEQPVVVALVVVVAVVGYVECVGVVGCPRSRRSGLSEGE